MTYVEELYQELKDINDVTRVVCYSCPDGVDECPYFQNTIEDGGLNSAQACAECWTKEVQMYDET